MQPDRTNYEIWLIDYLDGTLDEARVKQLISFLNENPDIKEEFAEILTYNIKPATGSFEHKNSLKKSVSDLSEKQFEYLCISAAENDLSEQQREELETIVTENPERRKTFETINRLKLVAPVVKYNRKSSLRKLTITQKIVRLSVIGLSAAAGIAIMISLFNVPAYKKDEFKPLMSANLTGDSNEVETNAIKIAANINTGEKKDIANPGRINASSTLQKTISDEMKASRANIHANIPENEPSAVNSEIRQLNISKIDFKQDVNIGGEEFTSTLIAINIGEISSVETPEKPGFNEFIAKIFREKILKSKTPETGSLKAYEIADAGIKGLNKLLGWQMSLQKTWDDKGDLKSLYFSSKILKFNAPVKKVQL
jgi:hypothetical protein